MKKTIALLLLLSVIATPAYSLTLLGRLIYKEARVGNDTILVNKITGKAEQIWVVNGYSPLSTQRGFGGIISDQEMYQARYEESLRQGSR